MGKETVLFKSEEKRSLQEVTELLRELADKLDKNKVVFMQGKRSVKVKVPSNVELEIKVEKETGKRKTKKKKNGFPQRFPESSIWTCWKIRKYPIHCPVRGTTVRIVEIR